MQSGGRQKYISGFYKSDPIETIFFIDSKLFQLGSVIHELGHIVGLAHEQSRVDRDYYVKLDQNKINLNVENFYNVGMTSINTPTESIASSSK